MTRLGIGDSETLALFANSLNHDVHMGMRLVRV
jgi:hypothetical protein